MEEVYILLDDCYNAITDGVPVGVYLDEDTARQHAAELNAVRKLYKNQRAVVYVLMLDAAPVPFSTENLLERALYT